MILLILSLVAIASLCAALYNLAKQRQMQKKGLEIMERVKRREKELDEWNKDMQERLAHITHK